MNSIDVAMSLLVSSRRGGCADVIRVGVACESSAGRRCPALVHRIVAAILPWDCTSLDDVHAKRKGRIIFLGMGRPGRRHRHDRKNRQSQKTHPNLLHRRRHTSARATRPAMSIAVKSRLLAGASRVCSRCRRRRDSRATGRHGASAISARYSRAKPVVRSGLGPKSAAINRFLTVPTFRRCQCPAVNVNQGGPT